MKTPSWAPSSARAEHGFLCEKVIHRTVLRVLVSYETSAGFIWHNTKKGGGSWEDSPFLLEINSRSDGGCLVAEIFLNDAFAFGALELPVQQEFFGHLF